jgi:hypothetical protein
MNKVFNVTGVCIPEKHYMVDIEQKLNKIIYDLIEQGKYFTINKARQFGKSTTLYMLERALSKDYLVISLSFEAADDLFESRYLLAEGLVRRIGKILKRLDVNMEIIDEWTKPISKETPFDDFDNKITNLCTLSDKKVILMIDEVDKSSDNQIFLSFLGLLRTKYLDQQKGIDTTFTSVILAGVYDIKNLKLKLHPDSESKYNSPWNIAADFDIDMSFSENEISSMLADYETDHHTGMNIDEMERLIYDYTSGYPYLVSYICKLIDEDIHLWTKDGVLEAIKIIVKGPNSLYDDMIKHIMEYQDLYDMLNNILFKGESYPYQVYDSAVDIGRMFGFIKDNNGVVAVSNRIFETQLYNFFIMAELKENNKPREIMPDINQFTASGYLDMDLVMAKFYEYYTDLINDDDDKFVENQGRKIFLMFLRPIINGTGNYYIEDQSRTKYRTDVIVDYKGKQYIIELKIWRGNEYEQRGHMQLLDYLEAYKLNKGYLVSFDFGKSKHTGIKEMQFNDKTILEVIV